MCKHKEGGGCWVKAGRREGKRKGALEEGRGEGGEKKAGVEGMGRGELAVYQ